MFVVNLGKFTIHLIGDKVVAIQVLFLYFTSKMGEIIQFHHPRWWKTMDQKSYLDVHGSKTPQVVFDLVCFWQSEISRWLPQKNRTVAGREFHCSWVWTRPKMVGPFLEGKHIYLWTKSWCNMFFVVSVWKSTRLSASPATVKILQQQFYMRPIQTFSSCPTTKKKDTLRWRSFSPSLSLVRRLPCYSGLV